LNVKCDILVSSLCFLTKFQRVPLQSGLHAQTAPAAAAAPSTSAFFIQPPVALALPFAAFLTLVGRCKLEFS
jgi:hypothetical protein